MGTKKSTRVAKRSPATETDAEILERAAPGSIAHILAKSPGGFEGALARLEAAKSAGKDTWEMLREEVAAQTVAATETEPALGQEDLDRIHAFLANQQRLGGTIFHAHIQERIARGRMAIHNLALGRVVTFTREECADVLCFIHCTEPAELLDPNNHGDAPDPYMGLLNVLEAIEESLRAEPAQRSAEARR
jgi:hypothetical protein